MSLKHAILGFLSNHPLTGYDLKKSFDQSVRHFWPANQSQIYRTLAELDEENYVEKEIISREDRLDMKVYSITEAGRQELHHWLSTPLAPRDYREPVLIQIYFGGTLSNDELVTLLKREIKLLEEKLTLYDEIYKMNRKAFPTVGDPRAAFLMISTLEFGILSDRISLEWLKSVMDRLLSEVYQLQDL